MKVRKMNMYENGFMINAWGVSEDSFDSILSFFDSYGDDFSYTIEECNCSIPEAEDCSYQFQGDLLNVGYRMAADSFDDMTTENPDLIFEVMYYDTEKKYCFVKHYISGEAVYEMSGSFFKNLDYFDGIEDSDDVKPWWLQDPHQGITDGIFDSIYSGKTMLTDWYKIVYREYSDNVVVCAVSGEAKGTPMDPAWPYHWPWVFEPWVYSN